MVVHMNEIPACDLTPEERPVQLGRFATMGRSIAARSRAEDGTIELELTADVDEGNLRALIAKESECCPFYRFDYDAGSRRLRIGVEDERYAPALDAIASAL